MQAIHTTAEHVLPRCLPGFEGINRYWNPWRGMVAAKLLPGEYYVTSQREQLVTVVGSTLCVFAYDAGRHLSGVAHFSLPPRAVNGNPHAGETAEYGAYVLDLLVNALTRMDAQRRNLQAMLFGAAEIWSGVDGWAREVVRFTRRHLGQQGVRIVGEVVGAHTPRKVWLEQTRRVDARVTNLPDVSETVRLREEAYLAELAREW